MGYRGTFTKKNFISDFTKTDFFNYLYKKHLQELVVGVRHNYINLYYNCDSIAKIIWNVKTKSFIASINGYYLGKTEKKGNLNINANDIIENYETIKNYSQTKSTDEKRAQQALILANNTNPNAKWYCFDLEYKKEYKNINARNGNFQGRFDIIAIEKETKQIAFIELKYGSNAIGGKSGIRTHVKDFYQFYGKDSNGEAYFDDFKTEAVSMLSALEILDENYPESLRKIKVDMINAKPSFYFITLDNNASKPNASTPKQTMSGYLFKDKRWGAKKVSDLVATQGDFYSLIHRDKSFNPYFLFSQSKLPDLKINDILDLKNYDVERAYED